MTRPVPWANWIIAYLCATGYVLVHVVHWPVLEADQASWRAMGSASAFRSPIFWLFAPVATLLHTGLLHLAANLWCLATLGAFIERRVGPIAVVFLWVTGAYVAMGLETLIGGVGRIGLSAVTYTLLGAAITHWRDAAQSPRRLYTVVAMLALLLLGGSEAVGLPPVIPEIAHVAHAAGLLAGLLIGPALTWKRTFTPDRSQLL